MGAVLTFLSTLFVFSVVNGTPLLYGTLGEILTEKSGNMNLGVEGILFMGGAAGLGGAFYYEKLAGANASPFVALLLAVFFAFLAGALASLLFSSSSANTSACRRAPTSPCATTARRSP